MQYLIPDTVTVGVVKSPEVIDVEQRQGDGRAFVQPASHGLVHEHVEGAAVADLGQPILVGQVFQGADVVSSRAFTSLNAAFSLPASASSPLPSSTRLMAAVSSSRILP